MSIGYIYARILVTFIEKDTGQMSARVPDHVYAKVAGYLYVRVACSLYAIVAGSFNEILVCCLCIWQSSWLLVCKSQPAA